MSKQQNNTVIAFKTISLFVNDLSEVFADSNHSLKLYGHLLSKTTLSHEKAVNKHIEIFTNFCVNNRDAILNRNIKNLTIFKIEYSPKVFIDFANIFGNSDKSTTKVIWNHLLTILAIVDPESNAKEVLKSLKDNSGEESNFLTDILEKCEEHVKPGANPMEAVSTIMSSGIFTDIMSSMNSGMQDGSLDLNKLMGSVQKMCVGIGVNLPPMDENNPGGQPNPMAMLNMVTGLLNTPNGGGLSLPPGLGKPNIEEL